MGPDYPDAPGYDPALQAQLGLMDLTGFPDGPPVLMGVPLVDLKAGDEVFAQTMLALLELAETGRGKRIDVSMARAAASWLHTTLPLLDLGAEPADVRRSGNEHREFVPVNVYRTADGFLYLAIGNDVQWRRFTGLPLFATLARADRETNEGRKRARDALRAEIGAILAGRPTAELLALLAGAGLVVAPVSTIAEVRDLPGIREHLTRTVLPDGHEVRLPPAAVSTGRREFPLSPRYGEHTTAVLREAGFAPGEIEDLRRKEIVH
jgi:crotonobetainyl-CoA:carnitine CoA-transferase CaiB-like acyl-CoA transferase